MAEGWRTIRIFISSTFRDMQAERDHLVRFVFPRLREGLLKRRMHLVDVDLRWGVTADQDAFALCMDEIDRCHPRFVCILGGRYGWVPPAGQRSITASEVHYAVLDRLDRPGFRHFYFRDPAVTNSIPEPYSAEYREAPGSAAEEALAALKRHVSETSACTFVGPGRTAETGLPVFEYPCSWNPNGGRILQLEAFGARVYRDLLATIDAEFGGAGAAALDEFADEDAAIDSFVEARVERYVVGSREPVFAELHRHAAGTGGSGCLCLVGDPGSGKSALLGHFYREYATAHGDEIVIPHFVGASSASANLREALRRWCHHLTAGANLPGEIPDDDDKLRDRFAELLGKAAAVKRVVIIVDAINQLSVAFQGQAMRWFPETLPAGARMILSTAPGPSLDALRARSNAPVEVVLPALLPADSGAIIDGFLSRYRKTLDVSQRAALLAKEDAGSPLYLLVALEELRTLGGYSEITERIRELPGQVRPLFTWILERLERDPGFRDDLGRLSGEDLVRRYCSSIASGRSGMAQAELVALISPGDPLGNVAALQRLLRPYLMLRGELLDFFHGQLREAVQNKYLSQEQERIDAHTATAAYFRSQADPSGDGSWRGDNVRGLSELPYHETEAEMWDALHGTLTDLAFLEAKCTHVAVRATGSGPDARKVYGGVYELQDDYRLALERMPS